MDIRRVRGKKIESSGDVVGRLRHIAGCYDDLDEKALVLEGLAGVVEELRAIRELLEADDDPRLAASLAIRQARSEASEVEHR